MYGRNAHLFAAAVVFTVAGASAASAGVIDGSGCCAPVRWSCGSNCGPMPTVIYGTPPEVAFAPQPVYRVDQGPDYAPPLLPYGEPSAGPESEPGPYPYVSRYSGYGYPFVYPGYRRHGYRGYRPFRHRFGYGPRFHTGMHRFGGHRAVTRMPMVRRGPVDGRRWHN